jgi:predicted secreted Zn-dependent protease
LLRIADTSATSGDVMPTRMALPLAAGLCVSLAHAPAAAEPTISETIKYYSVAGWNSNEVRADLNKRRPADGAGVRRDAVTTWDVKWRLTLRTTPRGCEVAGVRVTASIVILLPKLTQPRLANPAMSGGSAGGGLPVEALQDIWEDLRYDFRVFEERLLAHEKEHSRIGSEAARKIEATLLALPAAPDCDALRAAADMVAQKLLDEAAQRNLDYDIATRNGAAEGAVFPR